MGETKKCRICGDEKPLDDLHFPKSKVHKSGFRNECIDCRRKQAREQRRRYYEENKEKVLANKKQRDQANTEKIRQYQKEYRQRMKNENT